MVISYTDAEATYQPISGHDPLPYQAGQPLPDKRYLRIGNSGRSGHDQNTLNWGTATGQVPSFKLL